MPSPNLKPCPFCGAEAEIANSGDEYELVCSVGCTQCSARVRVADDTVDRDFARLEADAVAEWNKRADEERVRFALANALEDAKSYKALADKFRTDSEMTMRDFLLSVGLVKMLADFLGKHPPRLNARAFSTATLLLVEAAAFLDANKLAVHCAEEVRKRQAEICDKCNDGVPPESCRFYGEPCGCNAPKLRFPGIGGNGGAP